MIRAIALALLVCYVHAYSRGAGPTTVGRIDPRKSALLENDGPAPLAADKNESPAYVSKGCGFRNLNGISPAIRNSARQTNFAELPWTIMIFHSKNRVPIFKCGGSLIDADIVLTAAHCVKGLNPSHLTIRAGEWDTRSNTEPLPHQDRRVSNVTIHPGYVDEIFYNDLALLILNKPLEIAENVDVICPPQEDDTDEAHCVASGWGKDEFGQTGHYQVVLKSVDLSIDPSNICQNTLRTTRLGKNFILHESFICASGVDGADTCTGDGGGPLICPLKSDPSRYAQVGVVSWGIGCGQSHIPGVYADVTKARGWIHEVIASRNQPQPEPEPSTQPPPIEPRQVFEVPQPAPTQPPSPPPPPQLQQPSQPPQQQQPQKVILSIQGQPIQQQQQQPQRFILAPIQPYNPYPFQPNVHPQQIVVVPNFRRSLKTKFSW